MLKKLHYRFAILKQLNKFSFGVRKHFIIIIVISLTSMLISLITPKLYRLFIDQVIIERNLNIFLFVAVGYLSLFIFNTFLSFLRNYSNNILLNRVLFKIKHKILNNYLTLPFKDYDARSIGDMKMRIEDDVLKLSDFANIQTVDYLISMITAVVSALFIILIEWRLALFSIIVIPLTFYLDHKISIKEKDLININRGNSERWNSWLDTSIHGWKEIKALNLQKRQLRTFVRYAHNYADFFSRWINYWVARVLVVPKIIDEFLLKFSLYFLGGLLIIRDIITIGDLLVFALYYDLLCKSIRTLSSTDADLQSNMPFYDRLIQELNTDSKTLPQKIIPNNCNNHISMKNVVFSYDKTSLPVLNNFNLEITQGERVAIIGRSGAGKTTILKLITGMLSPKSGEILFSGVDINKINHKFLYSNLGFVLQENLLFNTTIEENLKLARPNATMDMLDEACKKACIYDFILAQPKGYDTAVGERGVKLSGGQRQRLVLARLFLRDVDILIFDEATSAIDQHSESIIHHAINVIGREKTIIVVAHRESSINLCDRIINLN
ncbi:ABC transporter ATP-binding protein [Oceanirhabdus sp. W0125-5]|uniref:ABC transporter ATP-binding protein n=1 Tax=Oceanirhabdus sp. W0125-5 TaxID=2999116 RepID=UPI0022F2B775|nr:ABC transporter ATP-binding protein [Oceanirhabdus sp. W0125-5]WBW97918.1 ABC transporter ATP-binding protein [Oceanirhabdus sp. W0125-5]